MSREELMHMIQQAGFALTDANLFLDSHMNSCTARLRLLILILSKDGPGFRLLGLGNWRRNPCGCMKDDWNILLK